jgi:hypothetical protein
VLISVLDGLIRAVMFIFKYETEINISSIVNLIISRIDIRLIL